MDSGLRAGEGRPPRVNPGIPGFQEYLRRWSELHGELTPSRVVGGWLALTYRLARPLAAARLSPDLLTLLGLLLAAAVLPAAAAGGHWPLAGVAVLLGSAVLDGLDGAVAVLRGRVTAWGHVLDSGCDRLADGCYLAALWLAGAPGPVVVAGGSAAAFLEYLRARAAAAGMRDAGVVTVGERPTRVIVTATFLLAAGLYPAAGEHWAAAGGWAWTVTGLVGVVQFAIVVRRRLGGAGGRPQPG